MKLPCDFTDFTAFPVALLVCDASGAIETLNREAATLLGLKDELPIARKAFISLLSPPSSYIFESMVLPQLKLLGDVQEVALDLLDHTGAFMPVLINFRARFQDGRWDGFNAAYLVTKNRREFEQNIVSMRAKLVDSEARFRRLAESTSDVILEIGLNGEIAYVSPAVLKVLGYQPEELIGRYFSELIHHDDRAAHSKSLTMLEDAIDPSRLRCELRILSAGGEWVWTEARPALLKTADQQIILGFINSLRDISKQKSALEKNESAQAFLDTVAKISRVGGWEFDFLENAMRWTQSAADVFEVTDGWQPGNLDDLIERFFEPEAGMALKETVENVLFSQEEALAELPIITGLGNLRWVEFLAQPHLVDGEVTGVIGALRDISERVQNAAILAEAALESERGSEAKSQFLANMSHEIRTPLNGVLGVATALGRTNLDERQRKMLDIITESGRTLSGLLNDILDLSKIEAGQLTLETVEIDIVDVFETVSALFEQSARAKGLNYSFTHNVEGQVWIIADPIRLKQVASNLIGNAIKFTSKGSVDVILDVAFNQGGQLELLFRVNDTGPGFSAEVRERLFGRFVQADTSTSRTFGGSGLGLSITKSLMSLMAGEVDCQSEVDVGSAFWFTAAFEVADSNKLHLPREVIPFIALSKPCKVLAVDDNDVNRSVLSLLLAEQVTSLTFAENGVQALEAFQTQKFDLILMDTQMPVMDGLTATSRIRALEAAQGLVRTPIIALSANVMENQVLETKAAGADDFVAKPIDHIELLEAMARWHQAESSSPATLNSQMAC